MQTTLSEEERIAYLKTIKAFHALFGKPGELRNTLWPLIVATAGSEYWDELDYSERQKIFIAYGEMIKFTEAACQILYGDIMFNKLLAGK